MYTINITSNSWVEASRRQEHEPNIILQRSFSIIWVDCEQQLQASDLSLVATEGLSKSESLAQTIHYASWCDLISSQRCSQIPCDTLRTCLRVAVYRTGPRGGKDPEEYRNVASTCLMKFKGDPSL